MSKKHDKEVESEVVGPNDTIPVPPENQEPQRVKQDKQPEARQYVTFTGADGKQRVAVVLDVQSPIEDVTTPPKPPNLNPTKVVSGGKCLLGVFCLEANDVGADGSTKANGVLTTLADYNADGANRTWTF